MSIKDANGDDITNTGNFAIVNPFRYRGYYYDTESGLYYLQSRYYDPTTGRFVNADSFEYLGASGDIIGYNLFTYCENNPVVKIDSDGSFGIITWVIIGACVGAVIGASYTAYKGYIGGKRGYDLVCSVLSGGIIGAAVGAAAGAAIYGVYYAAMAIGAKLTAGSGGALGKIIYDNWQKAEQSLRNAFNGVSRTINTPYGKRIIDSFSNNTAREAKYGYQGLSQFIRTEINKDAWLLKNGYVKKVEWHFYVSKVTSKGGPSAPLLNELLKNGFKVFYH